MLKLSKYTLIYPEKFGYHLVFNTLTHALVKINDDLKEVLECLPTNEQNLNEQNCELIKSLQENGIVVDENIDENEKTKIHMDAIKHRNDSLTITVLTTNQCNFACPYCFENGVKGNNFLNEEAAEKIVKWIVQRASIRKHKILFICFYGGEPLLNIKAIEIISSKVNNWAKEHSIAFAFSMTTNGSLLAPEVVDALIPYGLKSAQITLDGDKESHDKSRPFLNSDQSTFDIVLKNIEASVDKINILLTASINDDNLSNAYKLIDFLVDKGLHKKIASMGFSLIIPAFSKLKTHKITEAFQYIIGETHTNLQKELINKGFTLAGSYTSTHNCSLCQEDFKITIDVNGDLHKCNLLIGHPEYAVGDISSQESNHFHKKMLQLPFEQLEECHDCPYLPICNRGCRYNALIEGKDITAPVCEKENFEKMFPKWVKLDYEYMRKASQS